MHTVRGRFPPCSRETRAPELQLVHNHHNFAWKEAHDGQDHIVVRKGATPSFPGQLGFVGGSMGDDAVIVRGAAVDETVDAERARAQREPLYSTVHGAGRVMSRTEAAGKRKGRVTEARVVRPVKITPEMMREWVGGKGVVLRGGGVDESPHVYRRLGSVLAGSRASVGSCALPHTLARECRARS